MSAISIYRIVLKFNWLFRRDVNYFLSCVNFSIVLSNAQLCAVLFIHCALNYAVLYGDHSLCAVLFILCAYYAVLNYAVLFCVVYTVMCCG